MKITKEKLIDFIKEEIVQVLEQRQVTSSTVPKDNEQLQKLTTQLNGILNTIPDGEAKRNYFKLQRKKNREMGYNKNFLNSMIGIASELAKKSKGTMQQKVKAQGQRKLVKLNKQLVQQFSTEYEKMQRRLIPGGDKMTPGALFKAWKRTKHPIKKAMDAYAKRENPEGGGGKRQTDPDGYLTDIINMFKEAKPIKAQANTKSTLKQPSGNNTDQSAAALARVKQRYPKANEEAVNKIIELQTMLVKLNLAAPKLKNGKPFVDGVFGRSTIIALKKLYR